MTNGYRVVGRAETTSTAHVVASCPMPGYETTESQQKAVTSPHNQTERPLCYNMYDSNRDDTQFY